MTHADPHDPAAGSARPCVLVAEDDAEINGLLAEALREAGCEVLQAFDGLRAHELARERRPGVILLDLDLPRLYGQVVLRSLRRDPATADVQVVALTANAAGEAAYRCEALHSGSSGERLPWVSWRRRAALTARREGSVPDVGNGGPGIRCEADGDGPPRDGNHTDPRRGTGALRATSLLRP